MKKLVTLELTGDFKKGFDARFDISNEKEKPEIKKVKKLPANEEIIRKYATWQDSYKYKVDNPRIKSAKSNSDGPLDIDLASRQLVDRFNEWLCCEDFREIQEICQTELSTDDEIRILIKTNCHEVQQLPWDKWKWLESFDRAEVGISLSDNKRPKKEPEISNKSRKIKILAILGDSQGIDVEQDRQFLNEIPDAEIKFLNEPNRKDISDELWEKPWDILFFAGHSETQLNDGIIKINQRDSLNLKELKHGLKKAIAQGLQIAIFNSCDGFGLARNLQELNIPQVIVMKEPVPDKVAQEFLKYFLRNFAKDGKSLYQSVREAKKQLQSGLEEQYPCASWLPVIVQNSLTVPKTWSNFKQIKQDAFEQKIKRRVSAASLILTVIVIVLRQLGCLQLFELGAYDLMMQGKRALVSESPDDRIVVITIDDRDIAMQKEQGMILEKTIPTGETVEISLADSALSQLLQKINPYQPRVIGLDVKRDFPSTDPYLQNQLATNKNLFVICEGKANDNEEGIAPPPELQNSRSRIGFSDVAIDGDDKVRRYFWYGRFTTDSPCLPHQSNLENQYDAPSFSFLIAKRYLETRGKSIEFNQDKLQQGILEVKKEGAYLKAWRSNDGGPYKRKEDTREIGSGFQVPLNYRATKDNDGVANRTYSLTRVLQADFDAFEQNPEFIKNKIVLIGVTAQSKQDNFLTTFSRDKNDAEKTWGVYLHAHAISQIISAVEGDRPFLSVMSKTQEMLWILAWGCIGIIIIKYNKSIKFLIFTTAFATVILLTIHIISFFAGWWIPFVPALVVVFAPVGVLLIKVIYRAKEKGYSQVV